MLNIHTKQPFTFYGFVCDAILSTHLPQFQNGLAECALILYLSFLHSKSARVSTIHVQAHGTITFKFD